MGAAARDDRRAQHQLAGTFLGAGLDVAFLQRSVKAASKREYTPRCPFQGKSMPSVSVYGACTIEVLHRFLPMLQARVAPPTPERSRVVSAVVNRLLQEYDEQQRDTAHASIHEPLLLFVHGFPGTGKSQVIKWLIELFQLLAWSHSYEYFCVAYQNVMAALNGGQTCHSTCGIPFDLDGRDHGDRQDVGQRFLTFTNARVLVVDEVSMISAELDHTMERVMREAIE